MAATTLVDGLRFPEDPHWHDGKLWFVDMFASQVVAVDLAGNLETVAHVPDTTTSIGWTSTGQLHIVAASSRRIYSVENGNLVPLHDLSEHIQYSLIHLMFDRHDRAYLGEMGYDFGDYTATPKPGSVVLLSPDGSVRTVADDLGFPNGMIITPDRKTLIVAESHHARLTAFDIAADGSLSNRRPWAQFEDHGTFGTTEGQIVPDGICLDAEGAIWLASPNTRDVIRVREGGEIAERITIESVPLACTLGGPDARALFITSADSLNPFEEGSQGRIEIIVVDVPAATF